MSSESEIEQHVDSGSEEEQNDSSESQEVESEVESGSQEEDEEDCVESDSEREEVDSHDDIPVKGESTLSEKEENTSDEPKVKMESWQLKLIERYEQLYGKCLYVGFIDNSLSVTCAEKILKELCSHVVMVQRKPNNFAPFLVELNSPEDREKAIEELKIKDPHLKISIPHWEDASVVVGIFAKPDYERNLTNANKSKNKFTKKLTSTIVVKNIPPGATITDISRLFPNAVNINHRSMKGKYNNAMAVVELRTRYDAVNATQQNFRMGPNRLQIHLDIPKNWGGNNKNTNFQRRPYHAKKPFAHRPAYIKGGKRKLEDHSNVESISPKKEKLDSNNINVDEKRTESKENETILKKNEETFTKEMDNVKDKKHGKPVKKEVKIKKNKSIDTINNHSVAKDTVKEKKKSKKEKTEKPLKIKKPKVK